MSDKETKVPAEASATTAHKSFGDILFEVQQKIKKLQETKQLDELDASVLIDPWSTQDPMAIIGYIPPDEKYPHGQMLSWKNPKFRDQSANIGWQGWVAIRWNDPYIGQDGANLHLYLREAPPRMEGSERLDSYVRRGDAVLARLPVEAWMRRQIDREANYLEARNALKQSSETPNKITLEGGLVDQTPGNRLGAIGGFSKAENEIEQAKGPRIRAERPKAGE